MATVFIFDVWNIVFAYSDGQGVSGLLCASSAHSAFARLPSPWTWIWSKWHASHEVPSISMSAAIQGLVNWQKHVDVSLAPDLGRMLARGAMLPLLQGGFCSNVNMKVANYLHKETTSGVAARLMSFQKNSWEPDSCSSSDDEFKRVVGDRQRDDFGNCLVRSSVVLTIGNLLLGATCTSTANVIPHMNYTCVEGSDYGFVSWSFRRRFRGKQHPWLRICEWESFPSKYLRVGDNEADEDDDLFSEVGNATVAIFMKELLNNAGIMNHFSAFDLHLLFFDVVFMLPVGVMAHCTPAHPYCFESFGKRMLDARRIMRELFR